MILSRVAWRPGRSAARILAEEVRPRWIHPGRCGGLSCSYPSAERGSLGYSHTGHGVVGTEDTPGPQPLPKNCGGGCLRQGKRSTYSTQTATKKLLSNGNCKGKCAFQYPVFLTLSDPKSDPEPEKLGRSRKHTTSRVWPISGHKTPGTHNPEVGGSSPPPATIKPLKSHGFSGFLHFLSLFGWFYFSSLVLTQIVTHTGNFSGKGWITLERLGDCRRVHSPWFGPLVAERRWSHERRYPG